MNYTYYIIAKFSSSSQIHRQDAEPFLTQCLNEIGTDPKVDMLEIGELLDK